MTDDKVAISSTKLALSPSPASISALFLARDCQLASSLIHSGVFFHKLAANTDANKVDPP